MFLMFISEELGGPQGMSNEQVVILPGSLTMKRRIKVASKYNCLNVLPWGFPGGAVVKNLPAIARDTGLSPGPGRSHMPWSN